jgi:hypothetical protein
LQAESALCLVREREDSQPQVNPTTSLPEPLEIPDANLIIRSSDLVNFRVHKQVLAMASPVFKDLLSLPQPSDSESIDGLPVVQLSEGAELLHNLISMLYPASSVTPNSYDHVLCLLSACQKYEMVSIQSLIRDKVERGHFPAPVGAEVFSAYAIAWAKGLIPEVENTARLTLDYPMTFETLGDNLRVFEGSALIDLANFRRRCKDSLVACLKSFLETSPFGLSSIWIGCPDAKHRKSQSTGLPTWLYKAFSWSQTWNYSDLFTQQLPTPSSIREEYLTAIQTHVNCNFCLTVHATKGSTYCAEFESKVAQARDNVRTSHLF